MSDGAILFGVLGLTALGGVVLAVFLANASGPSRYATLANVLCPVCGVDVAEDESGAFLCHGCGYDPARSYDGDQGAAAGEAQQLAMALALVEGARERFGEVRPREPSQTRRRKNKPPPLDFDGYRAAVDQAVEAGHLLARLDGRDLDDPLERLGALPSPQASRDGFRSSVDAAVRSLIAVQAAIGEARSTRAAAFRQAERQRLR